MKKKLTVKEYVYVASMLFGLFFGAGNLIFPVHLGQMAGRNVLPAMIGFIITAVGIPIFGVAAIGVTHSDGLQTLSSKVGKTYGVFLILGLLCSTSLPAYLYRRFKSTWVGAVILAAPKKNPRRGNFLLFYGGKSGTINTRI